MGRILVVETNVEKYEGSKRATGLWLGEMVHFFDEVIEAGYEVDFVSPLGGYVPIDPHSLKFMQEKDWFWYERKEFCNQVLANTMKPSEVDPKKYDAIYYTGGHGVLWDYPKNRELAEVAAQIYENGGFVTAVCHGVVGLLPTEVDGKPLIQGKKLTGFTDWEERLNGTKNKVPFSTGKALKDKGSLYAKKRPFADHVVRDGRLITGQNPQLPRLVAKALITALKGGK